MIREEIEDKQLIEETLTSLAGRKVEIKTPQKCRKIKISRDDRAERKNHVG